VREEREAVFRSGDYLVPRRSAQYQLRSAQWGIVSLRCLLMEQNLCLPEENFRYICISGSWIILTIAARLPMNRFQAMAKIMAILSEDCRMKPGTQEYKLARKIVSSKIDNL